MARETSLLFLLCCGLHLSIEIHATQQTEGMHTHGHARNTNTEREGQKAIRVENVNTPDGVGESVNVCECDTSVIVCVGVVGERYGV